MTISPSKLFEGRAFAHVPRLTNTLKSRRLQFMKTRYMIPECTTCGSPAHYRAKDIAASQKNDDVPYSLFWCKAHMPPEYKRHLSLDWQWTRIAALADFADNGGLTK